MTTTIIIVAAMFLIPLVVVALYLYTSGVFTHRRAFQLGSTPVSRTVDLRIVPVVVFLVSDAGANNRRVCTVVNSRAEGNAPIASGGMDTPPTLQ
ncbi:MAG TPA: hypothetical protein VK901_13505 [Nitrospiraceae bacterium]|nr:hypothetical protein [Nitrospiraceae bacterium]